MKNHILLSPEGRQKLQAQLDDARSNGRRRMSDALREARSHGDLRENAAYDEAKLNQARLEGRIRDMEYILERAQIVERSDDAAETASLGTVVTLWDMDIEEEWTFTLVGSAEADPTADRISVASPLGEAVFGARIGDQLEVQAPRGVMRYQVRLLQ
jgi:transcription elongation factor GreA